MHPSWCNVPSSGKFTPTIYTGAQLHHSDIWISPTGRRETIRKTEGQRKDVSNLFNSFMGYKGLICDFIV